MSNEYPQEFRYLILFAALSGRPFTKSEIGIKMTNQQLDPLIRDSRLLDVQAKGHTRTLSANEETRRWAGEHLHVEFTGKHVTAPLKIFGLLRAKTFAFLKANRVSFEDFVNTTVISPVLAHPQPGVQNASSAVEGVRRAYLALSGAAYDVRILLKDLRRHLPMDREAQDDAFRELIKSGEADFYPEDDPMSRGEEDDRAALVLADRRRDVIYLHRGLQT